MDRTDEKITLCKIKFSLSACKELSEHEILSLSETARNFFYFIQSFGNRSFLNIWMVEDRLQDLKSSTCGIFQIYFYHKLFNPDEGSKIGGETKLRKKTVETLLNEIFILDDKQNEIKMKEFADDFVNKKRIVYCKVKNMLFKVKNMLLFPSSVLLSLKKIIFLFRKNGFQNDSKKMSK